jgi:uncharacterized protein (DUF1800 family)
MASHRNLLPDRPLAIALFAALAVLARPLAAPQDNSVRSGNRLQDVGAIVHVLNRVTFGPRPVDVARVEQMGLPAFVEWQLHPERIDDSALETRLAAFATLTMSSHDLAEQYFLPAIEIRRRVQQNQPAATGPVAGGSAADAPADPARAALSREDRQVIAAQRTVFAELAQARMLRAVESTRQLQEVLADFWLNHFNVFVGKGQVRQFLTEYDRDAIRPHVLGRFRDLLGAVAHSPAMLFYLDNWQSSAPAQRERQLLRRGAPLAPARTQTRGINENYARELMELHTLGVDGGYTQADVVALARILTGWTIDRPRQGGSFVFRPALHDTGTKTLLGVTFRNEGEQEGERALDLLAEHPATAHHIAFELAQRFVADAPPAALVDRAAKTFRATKGDIREVMRTILTSPEFFADDVRRAKVKTPLEFVASAVRATGATIASAQPLVAAMQNLGMPLFGCQPPTGYATTADAWINTGALLNRMNFAVQLVSGGRLATDLRALAPDTSHATQDALVDRLLSGHASDATRQTLARANSPQDLIALTLGSPEFQRR